MYNQLSIFKKTLLIHAIRIQLTIFSLASFIPFTAEAGLQETKNETHSAYSIYEIAQHVITGKPYVEKSLHAAGVKPQETRVYKLLTQESTPEIIQKVRDFTQGKLSEEIMRTQIANDSAYQFLAAAKIVDIESAPTKLVQSTYKIREIALLCSIAKKNGQQEINMINAFSTPPLDKENITVMLANEMHSNHPEIMNAKTVEESNAIKSEMNKYCQKEALMIPDMIPVIETVLSDRLKSMLNTADFLPDETMVVFKGCSGAGKSFALRKFTNENLPDISSEKAVQGTDNLKNDFKFQTSYAFNDQQIHLLGFSSFRILSEVMKDNYPKLSLIQEGWFNSTSVIEGLFKDLNTADLKLIMHDFDGDYESICLRVLARYEDKNCPQPPFNEVERGFKTSRESRSLLLNSLRPSDQYVFHYVHKNGVIDEQMNPRSVVSAPNEVNEEIEKTKKTEITTEHVQIFGEFLNKFVGLTIEEAFEIVRN